VVELALLAVSVLLVLACGLFVMAEFALITVNRSTVERLAGKGDVQARLYNKTIEAKERTNDAYVALLVARHGDNGDAYDSEQEVWRLEFELKRDGAKAGIPCRYGRESL